MDETSFAKVQIIGIGGDGLRGLSGPAREMLARADLVLGSDNVLQALPELQCERHPIGVDLDETLRLLQERLGKQRIVVAAGGDPLFYGVARYLCDRLGKECFDVWPHVSSMQLAFARVKESWEEAFLTNLATHSLNEVIDRIRTAETVGLFPSERETPPVIARALLNRGIDYFDAYVCENLGAPDERVTRGELREIAGMEFAPLCVVVLRRKPGRPDQQRLASQRQRFGNPDDLFAQSRPQSGLITPAEVRAIALAQLGVQPTSIVWDVGAGSGSVAIEAAQLAENGMVFAIEQEAADYHLILANAETFGVKNVRAIHGTAPAIFADLPAPDAVFVGGTGKEAAHLLMAAHERLRPGGRLVVHVATLESLATAYGTLKNLAGTVDALLVQMARGVSQLETLRFDALNPTYLLSVRKG